MAIVHSSEFGEVAYSVGMHQDENGNPLVAFDNKVVGRVDDLLELLGRAWLEWQRAKAVPTPDWLIKLREG